MTPGRAVSSPEMEAIAAVLDIQRRSLDLLWRVVAAAAQSADQTALRAALLAHAPEIAQLNADRQELERAR